MIETLPVTDLLSRGAELVARLHNKLVAVEKENTLLQEIMALSEHEGLPAATVLRDKLKTMKRHRMEVPVPKHIIDGTDLAWRMARRYPEFTKNLLLSIRAGQL